MFGNKKRIKELEHDVSRLNFIANNPPAYKVGDKPNKDHIVTEAKVKECWGYGFYCEKYLLGWNWEYKIINIKTGRKV